MRRFDSAEAETYVSGTLNVGRWEQYGLGDVMPFGAMWYTVPAGQSSPRDCHPEHELSLVVSGSGTIEASDRMTDVEQGNAFLLDSTEAHIIHNRSTEVPLVIFSAYWMPRGSEPPVDGQ